MIDIGAISLILFKSVIFQFFFKLTSRARANYVIWQVIPDFYIFKPKRVLEVVCSSIRRPDFDIVGRSRPTIGES